jgi:hypothetical protein
MFPAADDAWEESKEEARDSQERGWEAYMAGIVELGEEFKTKTSHPEMYPGSWTENPWLYQVSVQGFK